MQLKSCFHISTKDQSFCFRENNDIHYLLHIRVNVKGIFLNFYASATILTEFN